MTKEEMIQQAEAVEAQEAAEAAKEEARYESEVVDGTIRYWDRKHPNKKYRTRHIDWDTLL